MIPPHNNGQAPPPPPPGPYPQPYQGPPQGPPWPQYAFAPPPQPKSQGKTVAIVFGVIFFAIIFVSFVIGVVGGVTKVMKERAHKTAYTNPRPSMLTESFAMKNGLAVAHYPPEFAAKSIDGSTLSVARNNEDGTDELVLIAAVKNPITDDTNEFARLLVQAMSKKIVETGGKWIETSRSSRKCFHEQSGLVIDGYYVATGALEMRVHACFFMRDSNGYELKSIVPAKDETADLPMLQAMIDATEFK